MLFLSPFLLLGRNWTKLCCSCAVLLTNNAAGSIPALYEWGLRGDIRGFFPSLISIWSPCCSFQNYHICCYWRDESPTPRLCSVSFYSGFFHLKAKISWFEFGTNLPSGYFEIYTQICIFLSKAWLSGFARGCEWWSPGEKAMVPSVCPSIHPALQPTIHRNWFIDWMLTPCLSIFN